MDKKDEQENQEVEMTEEEAIEEMEREMEAEFIYGMKYGGYGE
jgi:hypothetical protein